MSEYEAIYAAGGGGCNTSLSNLLDEPVRPTYGTYGTVQAGTYGTYGTYGTDLPRYGTVGILLSHTAPILNITEHREAPNKPRLPHSKRKRSPAA